MRNTSLITKVVTENHTIKANQYHTIVVRNVSDNTIKINENITVQGNSKWEWINEPGITINTDINIRVDSTKTNRVEIELYY